MRKLIIPILLLATGIVSAQSKKGFSGALGEGEIKTQLTNKLVPMGVAGNRVYFISPDQSGSKYVFQSYEFDDMTGRLEFVAPTDKDVFDNNAYLAAAVVNNQPVVFTIENNKKAKTTAVNYFELDKGSLVPGSKTKLADVKGNYEDLSFAVQQKQGINREFETMLFAQSPDKKTFYLLAPQRGKMGKEELELLIHIYAFNDKFEPLWDKEQLCTATSKRDEPKMGNFIADNAGNVYFRYIDYDFNIKKESIYQQYYKVYTVNQKEGDYIKLKMGSYLFPDLHMKVYDDGALAMATMKGLEEYDLFSYDNDGVCVALHTSDNAQGFVKHAYTYDKDAVEQNVKYSNVDEKGRGDVVSHPNPFQHARYKDFFVTDDGRVIVACEVYSFMNTSSIGQGYVETPMEYYDTFLFCVDPTKDNEAEWIARVPKDQRVDLDVVWGSSISMNDGENTFVIYNDNAANLELDGSGVYKRIVVSDYDKPDVILAVQKVDAKGEMQEYKVVTNVAAGGKICVNTAAVVDGKVAVIPVLKNGRIVNYVGVSLGE